MTVDLRYKNYRPQTSGAVLPNKRPKTPLKNAHCGVHPQHLGRAISCQTLKTSKNDDHAEQCLPWETIKKQHVHRKQVNRHNTYTTTMCKQRAVSVCPTSELWAAELRTCAQLFSPCCQWASPGWACPKGLHWEACTQSDIWTTQEGGIISILRFFFNLTASLSISLHLSLSVFITLSLLCILPWRGPQVAVTRERMMNSPTSEPADSLAGGLSPCSLHPLLYLTFSPFLLSSPLPHFSLAGPREWGSWGTLYMWVAMNGDTSQQPSGH